MHLTFDIYAINEHDHLYVMFRDVSLQVAEIMVGLDRPEFHTDLLSQGWSGNRPAWTRFKPVVAVLHDHMLQLDQFTYLVELMD